MKQLKLFTILLLVVFGFATTASALIIDNGSFETGDFTGWTQTFGVGGSSSVQNSFYDNNTNTTFTATDGSYFANLASTSFLSQGQTWSVGEELIFDFVFDANDYMPFNDYALLSVFDTGNSLIDTVTLANVAGLGNYGTTGWNTYSYTFAAAGAGSIQFGSVNVLDSILDSNLLVDNVSSNAPVPEPSTILLMGAGLLGLVGYNRKRFSKKS